MEKFIENEWKASPRGPYEVAWILRHDHHPEGVDLLRVRFQKADRLPLCANVGHIISPLSGSAKLTLQGQTLRLAVGTHVYLPRGSDLQVSADFAAVVVSAGTPEQSSGSQVLIRDEEFLRCAAERGPLRWMLTPQYLSRRVFLHHDATLLSKAGHPISWFRTTMFDVRGLPENQDGDPVFKMSYNYRTEPNVLVDVKGKLQVRMAEHPYQQRDQSWGPWTNLSGEHTYHLNEQAGGPEEEWVEQGGKSEARRNKHEVYIQDGHATLFCIFDPSPTGTERHSSGAYSDYGPLERVVHTPQYASHLERIAPFDAMVDALSWAKAGGSLQEQRGSDAWQLAERGRKAQLDYERTLHARLLESDPIRAAVIETWMGSEASR